jgi:hypothetical protein
MEEEGEWIDYWEYRGVKGGGEEGWGGGKGLGFRV